MATEEELKRAYKAFKKRLKLARLDDESGLSRGGSKRSTIARDHPAGRVPARDLGGAGRPGEAQARRERDLFAGPGTLTWTAPAGRGRRGAGRGRSARSLGLATPRHARPLLAALGRARATSPASRSSPAVPAAVGPRVVGSSSPAPAGDRSLAAASWRCAVLGLEPGLARDPRPAGPASVPALGLSVSRCSACSSRRLPARQAVWVRALVVRRALSPFRAVEARRLVLPRSWGRCSCTAGPAVRLDAEAWPGSLAVRGDAGACRPGRFASPSALRPGGRGGWGWSGPRSCTGRCCRSSGPSGLAAQHDRPGLERGDDGRGLAPVRLGSCVSDRSDGAGDAGWRRWLDGVVLGRMVLPLGERWGVSTPGRRTALYASHVERTASSCTRTDWVRSPRGTPTPRHRRCRTRCAPARPDRLEPRGPRGARFTRRRGRERVGRSAGGAVWWSPLGPGGPVGPGRPLDGPADPRRMPRPGRDPPPRRPLPAQRPPAPEAIPIETAGTETERASPCGCPRASGILLHPTSLPGRFGIGDLGPPARRVRRLPRRGRPALVADPPPGADRLRQLAVPVVFVLRRQPAPDQPRAAWSRTAGSTPTTRTITRTSPTTASISTP